MDKKNADDLGFGQNWSRLWVYRRRASTLVGSSGMALLFWNFEFHIVITPSSQSMWSRSRRTASPQRMPVTASRPIRAS